MDLVLGAVYFLLFFAIVTKYDKKLTNFIKSKDTDRLFGIKVLGFVATFFVIALVFYTLKDYHDNIEWVNNYFVCYMR